MNSWPDPLGDFFHLGVIEIDRRGAAEDRHRHLDAGFFLIDAFDVPDAIIIENPRLAGGHLGAAKLSELNDARFHHRFAGQGVYADLLLKRFIRASRRWGLDESRDGLDCSKFTVPNDLKKGFAESQMSLF